MGFLVLVCFIFESFGLSQHSNEVTSSSRIDDTIEFEISFFCWLHFLFVFIGPRMNLEGPFGAWSILAPTVDTNSYWHSCSCGA